MNVSHLRDAVKVPTPLRPDDTAARAVRLLRAQGLPALPVAEDGQLVGIVYEGDLAALAGAAADPRATAQAAQVRQVMRPVGLVLREGEPVSQWMEILREPEAVAVPMVSVSGRYLGMVQRRDLLAAVSGEPPAPTIAGMATPFGVHLTTGALRAGASDLALAATGAAWMGINLVAGGMVWGAGRLVGLLPSLAALASGDGPPRSVVMALTLLLGGIHVATFLILLRLSPLSGVHAAEHMVVHAVEEGEDLTLEKVRPLPRVHARCGTNFMALLILVIIAQQFLSSVSQGVGETTGSLTLVVLVMVVLVTWRRLGAWLQRWVTTRRPSDRQLVQAIEVGEALLGKIRAHPRASREPLVRLWNMGILQVMGGFVAAMAAIEYGWPMLSAAWSRLIG